MSNFAPLINKDPMDPFDARFTYGMDFVDLVDDGGTLVTPLATIDAAGVAAGVTLNSVVIINSTQLVFRPTVSGGEQANPRWAGDGVKFVVTVSLLNASGQKIERSGKLWIANR